MGDAWNTRLAAVLEAAAFAPYGTVIEATGGSLAANQGTAARFDQATRLLNERPEARLAISVFRCAAQTSQPFTVRLLEKHPCSTQIFVPMNAARYLVIVALGGDTPDLATLSAFVAHGAQAIAYHPGVWHHPMVALDATIDFVCFVHEDGTARDCVVHPLARPGTITY
ncbi:MAG: ureidoglycolate lyase [Myxococcales bacterium]|nr:ureidoglycolate lyase [Myxococcales bacterium]